jgi:hypothetical protein
MKTIGLILVVALTLGLAAPILAAEPLTPVAPKPAKLTGLDSLRALAAQADTVGTKKRSDTVQVVMHHHNHRQQIITGGVVMACLAGIVVVMNNYNPRPVIAEF